MKPKRKNIRWQGYDYSRNGLYFLTIVVQNRLHLFGHVENGEMVLNDAGRMIEKWYREIENKYPDKRCREMVVMPNHFHGIIEIPEMNADDVGMLDDQNERVTDAQLTQTNKKQTPTTDGRRTTTPNGQRKPMTDAKRMFVTNIHQGAHVGAPLRGRPDSTKCDCTKPTQSNGKKSYRPTNIFVV